MYSACRGERDGRQSIEQGAVLLAEGDPGPLEKILDDIAALAESRPGFLWLVPWTAARLDRTICRLRSREGLELRTQRPPRRDPLIGVADAKDGRLVERTAGDLHRERQAARCEADA